MRQRATDNAGQDARAIRPTCTPTELEALLGKYPAVDSVDLTGYKQHASGGPDEFRKDRCTPAALSVLIRVAGDRICLLSLPCTNFFNAVLCLTHLTSLKMGLFSTSQVAATAECLTGLRHLHMTCHDRTSHDLDLWGLTKLSSLQHLVVSCQIKPAVLVALTGLTALQFCGSSNAYSSKTPIELCPALQRLHKLEHLTLKGSYLSLRQVQCISTLTGLRSLGFESCKFVALTALCALTRLEHIQCWC